MRNIGLILAREYKMRVRKASFIVTIVVTVLIVLLAIYLPTIVGFFTAGSQTKLAVINETNQASFGGQPLATIMNLSLNTKLDKDGKVITPKADSKPPFVVTFNNASETDSLTEQVRNSKVDALLIIKRDPTQELSFKLITNKGPNDSTVLKIQDLGTRLAISDRLERAGLQQQQASTLFSAARFDTTYTSLDKKGTLQNAADQAGSYILVYGMIIALFTSITAFGSMIAQGVAEEKSSRVMEIMITAAKPFELLFGKVIGIGLVGISVFAITGLIAIPATLLQSPISHALVGEDNATSMSLAGNTLGLILVFVIFYLLGYFLYSTIFAAAGSLCSRIEDVQQALTPITTVLLVVYFVAIFGLQAIDAPWVVVCSYIPFFSPILMLARIGLGSVSPIEVIISLVILAGTILLCTWGAARIYKVGVLLYGKRPNFFQAIGFAKAGK